MFFMVREIGNSRTEVKMGSEGKSRKRRSSPSPEEEEERKRKHRRGRHEREEKEEKSRKRKDKEAEKKREKKSSRSSEDKAEKKSKDKHKHKKDKKQYINPDDIEEISKDDYFSKNNEFATWLKEERDIYFSDLSSESAHDLFSRFVKDWNKGKLELRYYEGIKTAPRTAHNWKIKSDK